MEENEIPIADRIRRYERMCFGAKAWSINQIRGYLVLSTSVTVMTDKGYAIGCFVGGEAEIYRIGVPEEERGNGYGTIILTEFIKACLSHGELTRVFLEVRSRNIPAVCFYKKHGFTMIGRRKQYYGDDDALVFEVKISGSSEEAE
ncbi:MAG: GNAT family N-acetyltransferase [Oscillospiraceae bacterium]|jgi:ribosomal-protein-alanine N-acetyltransferase|nr:GNAT family N-acetyltransferase [Oscillospiraceae bacterium]